MLKIFFFFFFCICSILASAPWLNEDKPNSTLTEGDIALEDAPDSNEQRSAIEGYQVHASASSPYKRKWVNNIVPFIISTDFSTDQRSTILAAMVEIHQKTCISFVGRVDQNDFILFRKLPDGSLCSSLLGREGGRQHVNLTDECVVRNTVLHELMHVLGFQHEHSRHDRDKNIRINLTNVKSIYKQHLELIRKVDPMDSLVRYDYKSITHYPEDAFSAYNNRKTIISKFRAVKVKSDGLSETDVWKINYIYNCSNEGENVESSNEHAETTTTNVPNIGTTTVDQQRRYQDETNTSQRTTSQLSIQSTIKQVQTTSSTTIRETSIGTTLKMTTSTTTRPISVLNKEIIKAVEVGNETAVRKLLNEGADVNARTIEEYRNKTLLHIASEKGHEKVVSLLFAHGANVHVKDVSSGDAAIHKAAESGYANIVSLLLSYNVSVEMKGEYDKTPLHYAARGGHENVVSLLLDKGANNEARNTNNSTPLHNAAWNGHVNIVSLLLDKGANIEARNTNNSTPLHVAAQNGHANVVSLLLDKGASIEARNTYNSTPLHSAAWNGHVNVVSLLLDKGASIEARNTYNSTPLHSAAQNGHANVVSLLLDKGASIEARNTYNSTPLHSAAWNGHVNVVSLLLDKGANMEVRSYLGRTPLHSAAENGQANVVPFLLNKGAKIEAKDVDAWTPLHLASYFGRKSVVLLLLDNGANIFAKGGLGTIHSTPLDLAKPNNKPEIVEILERKQRQLTGQ